MTKIADLSSSLSIPSAETELMQPSPFQDQSMQMLGGMLAGSRELVQGKIRIQGVDERILLGDATGPMEGIGIFMGEDGQGNGDYDFRIGDPEGTYLHWDASAGTLIVAGFNEGSQNFVSTLTWTATDQNTATWSSGTIKTSDGTSYSIAGGNTGNILATTYIYLDSAVSLTVLQTTTTATSAIGGNKLLVATVAIGAGGSECIITVVGAPGTTINGSGIVTGSIVASKISVSQLSAITADLGSITAGSISVVNGGNTIGLTPSGTYAIFSGTTGSPQFKVTPAGAVTASDLTITGGSININSTFQVNSSGNVVANSYSLNSGSITSVSGGMAFNNLIGVNFYKTGNSTLGGNLQMNSGNRVVLSAVGAGVTIGINSQNDEIYFAAHNTQVMHTDHSDGKVYFDNANINVGGVDKSAIVPTSQGYKALFCAEAPEVWFFDFCKDKTAIDPLFLEVTEGETKFIKCEDGTYQVWRRRKDFGYKRFENKSLEQFEKNNQFWSQAK